MSPAGLSGVLVACLGAGSIDLALLNLTVLPVLFGSHAEPRASTLSLGAHVLLARETAHFDSELASSPPAPPQSAPARPPELVVILEFDRSSHRVRRQAALMLQETLSQLHGAGEIVVVGHADASGPEELNEHLSAERARAVAQHLAGAGISVRQIRLEARGEREPRLDGNSRRVEIYVRGRP